MRTVLNKNRGVKMPPKQLRYLSLENYIETGEKITRIYCVCLVREKKFLNSPKIKQDKVIDFVWKEQPVALNSLERKEQAPRNNIKMANKSKKIIL